MSSYNRVGFLPDPRGAGLHLSCSTIIWLIDCDLGSEYCTSQNPKRWKMVLLFFNPLTTIFTPVGRCIGIAVLSLGKSPLRFLVCKFFLTFCMSAFILILYTPQYSDCLFPIGFNLVWLIRHKASVLFCPPRLTTLIVGLYLKSSFKGSLEGSTNNIFTELAPWSFWGFGLLNSEFSCSFSDYI